MTPTKPKNKTRPGKQTKLVPPPTVIVCGLEIPFEDSLEYLMCASDWHPEYEDDDIPDGEPF